MTDAVLILLADTVLLLHTMYVAFVVLGLGAIILGGIRGWSWTRRAGFRFTHLAAIAIVAVQALARVPCPLTVWERDLRIAAGQSVTELPFVPRLLRAAIFFEASPEFFTALYVVVFLLVAATLWFLPPQRRR